MQSSKIREIRENIEIARSLVRHHTMWSDPSFVARRIAEQQEIIRRAEETIAKFTRFHEEAESKIAYYKAREKELLAALYRETVQPDIDKLAAQINKLTAKLGAEAVERIIKGKENRDG